MEPFYVTPQVLGGAFPEQKGQLQTFARQWEHLLVINLCVENPTYTLEGALVENWPVVDGFALCFGDLKTLIEHIDMFIAAGEGKNGVLVHCKHGKGRTGMILVAYLLYKYRVVVETANSLLGKQQRLYHSGVTIRTQLRYLGYLKRYLRNEIRWDPFDDGEQNTQPTWVVRSFLINSGSIGSKFNVKLATLSKCNSKNFKKTLEWKEVGCLKGNINYQTFIEVFEDVVIQIDTEKLIRISYTVLGANLALENETHANIMRFAYEDTDGYAGTNHKGKQLYSEVEITYERLVEIKK